MYFYHCLQQELDNFRMKIATYQYLRGGSQELHVIGWDVSKYQSRLVPIRNTTDHQGNLNARSWILQNLNIFHCTGSRAQLKVNVKTRKYFPILLAVIFERRTFESRRHCNFRRWCGNELHQQERNNAHDTGGRGQSFEQLPTIVSQHEYISWVSIRRGKGR